tara:strand:+ start:513 stop:884 length:372 start_codon:yes stop_codon:yes gene_type:complete
MPFILLADFIVVVHITFVGFVALGGLMLWRWPRTVWLHVPAVCWGIGIEWTGKVCPLTPLENWLRRQGDGVVYEYDFIERYGLLLLYPEGLTRWAQVLLGTLLLAVNLIIYGVIWRRYLRSGM